MSRPITIPPGTSGRCIECGMEVANALIFRVIRTDRQGQRYVVCQPCADRAHAAAQPVPLQVQREAPPRSALTTPRQQE